MANLANRTFFVRSSSAVFVRSRVLATALRQTGPSVSDNLEDKMNFIENETEQKLRGGYYTPSDLAIFIAQWVKEISPTSVLEPSCGDGVFFSALSKVSGFQKSKIMGFELDPVEAVKAREGARDAGLDATTIHCSDFLQWSLDALEDRSTKFDAIVGNPPFIRYQYLPEPFQVCAEAIFKTLALPFTKHTNAWVSFVLASMALLRPGGRLAMVVPSEIGYSGRS